MGDDVETSPIFYTYNRQIFICEGEAHSFRILQTFIYTILIILEWQTQ